MVVSEPKVEGRDEAAPDAGHDAGIVDSVPDLGFCGADVVEEVEEGGG